MKTILITGSTDGIGKIAALQFAEKGHKIILHGRNQEKLSKTVQEIREQSANGNIHGYVADLSNLKAVSSLADQLLKELDQIDVLVNNAGVFHSKEGTTIEGLDMRFAVNYLAPVLLTNRLKPLLQKSSSPRVINLSSAAQSTVSINALNGDENLAAQQAYAQSKLALTMWSFDLAQNWGFANIIALNPGSLLNTKMVKEAFGRHWSPAEKGADIIYALALSDRYKEKSGEYFDNDMGAFGEAHPDAYESEKISELLIATKALIS